MKELIEIQSTLNAPKSQYNKFGHFKYRSCEDILAAVKPLLTKCACTLTISDDVVLVGDRIYIKATATLTNGAGEKEITTAFAREEIEKKGMDGSQVTGAASSYARKYALNGLFAIDDNKDSDATNTYQQEPQQEAQQDSAPQQTPAPAQPNKGSIAARKEEDLIKQVHQITDLEVIKSFYDAAPEAYRKKGTAFYTAVINQATKIQNGN